MGSSVIAALMLLIHACISSWLSAAILYELCLPAPRINSGSGRQAGSGKNIGHISSCNQRKVWRGRSSNSNKMARYAAAVRADEHRCAWLLFLLVVGQGGDGRGTIRGGKRTLHDLAAFGLSGLDGVLAALV